MVKIFKEKTFKNIVWMTFDKVFLMVLQFFIGVKIVNYYGGDVYGIYMYAFSIVALSPILIEILNNRIIKKYYKNGNESHLVSTITTIKTLLAIFIFLIVVIIGKVINIEASFYNILIILSLNNIFTSSTLGVESYFEYDLNSKKIVLLNNFVKLFSYISQYVGVMLSLNIIIIPVIRCVGSIIRSILLLLSYKRQYKRSIKISFDKQITYKIFKESKFLWLSFISYLLYSQLDKIMIGNLLSTKDVATYSIATQLIGVLTIVLGPFQASIFSKALNYHNENYEKYIEFYKKMNWYITQFYLIGVVASIIVVKILFFKVFSSEYEDAIVIYIILSVGIFFKANTVLQTGHLTLINKTKPILIKNTLGLFINIILNYVLIKKIGVYGAAISTSITQFLTLFFFDFFIKSCKEHSKIQLKSINFFYILKITKAYL